MTATAQFVVGQLVYDPGAPDRWGKIAKVGPHEYVCVAWQRTRGYRTEMISTHTRYLRLVPIQYQTAAPCPLCGAAMRQTRRGATLAKRGPAFVCPADEDERAAGTTNGVHPSLRSWQAHELTTEAAS